MSVITFDTLKFVERLKADIARIERDLLVVKWMVGATFGGVLALMLKAIGGLIIAPTGHKDAAPGHAHRISG
ncbi:MAG: hypothetical protein H7841_07015 [Magnetospirillum sp. WYHS-4]